jgi:hypothetical protein
LEGRSLKERAAMPVRHRFVAVHARLKRRKAERMATSSAWLVVAPPAHMRRSTDVASSIDSCVMARVSIGAWSCPARVPAGASSNVKLEGTCRAGGACPVAARKRAAETGLGV